MRTPPVAALVHVGLLECASKSSPKTRVFEAPNRGIFRTWILYLLFKRKNPELEDGHRQKISPKRGYFFSDKVLLGGIRQCTHKHLQTSHETQLEGPGIFIILRWILG